jgi:hypothetical protein
MDEGGLACKSEREIMSREFNVTARRRLRV